MDYLHRYMLIELSKSLTDEERAFLAGQDRESRHNEVMRTLDEIKRKQSFGIDLGANIAGNAIYDSALWIARQLLKRIR